MTVVQENVPTLWRARFPFPSAESHKYTRGSALIRGGAIMTGASRLSARAAQRVGAGLVTLAAPSKALPIYAEALESVTVKPCDVISEWQKLAQDARLSAVLMRPGMGIGPAQVEEVLDALKAAHPCVLDADALTSFEGQPATLFEALHDDCVLTPHEGEFARLFGAVGSDRLLSARNASKAANCVILLKGAETLVVAPNGDAVINHNAPPWLATGGSGDVLAGLILGLVAQKMPTFEATCAAVWLHGEVANRHGVGLIAEDIVTGLPAALQDVLRMA